MKPRPMPTEPVHELEVYPPRLARWPLIVIGILYATPIVYILLEALL